MRSFNDLSKKKNFTDDFYPGSKSGVKQMTLIYKIFKYLITFLILYLICRISMIFIKYDISNFKFSSILNNKSNFKEISLTTLKACLDKTSDFLLIIFLILLAIFLILFIFYLFNMVSRQRNFERYVLINDLKAIFLKKAILKSANIKKKYKQQKRIIADKDKKDQKDIINKDIYKEILKMYVFINSRQSLDEPGVIATQYRIFFNLPSKPYELQEGIKKETENFNDIGNTEKKGKIKFGSMFLSEDKTYIVSRAWTYQDDKYYRKNESKNKKAKDDNTIYESSYPLSLLNDQQDVIDEKTDLALQWTKRTSKVIDMFLSTKKVNAQRIKVDTGNANALFVYDLAEDSDLKSFDKFGENLDSYLKKKGCSAEIDEGKLLIIIPLPKDLKIPINVPTLYRDAFG